MSLMIARDKSTLVALVPEFISQGKATHNMPGANLDGSICPENY
jgi:hypothetical protein